MGYSVYILDMNRQRRKQCLRYAPRESSVRYIMANNRTYTITNFFLLGCILVLILLAQALGIVTLNLETEIEIPAGLHSEASLQTVGSIKRP